MKNIVKIENFFKTLILLSVFLFLLVTCSDVGDSTTTTSYNGNGSTTTTTNVNEGSTTTTEGGNTPDSSTTTTTSYNGNGSTTTTTNVNESSTTTTEGGNTPDGSTTTTTSYNGNDSTTTTTNMNEGSTTTTEYKGGNTTTTTEKPSQNQELYLLVKVNGTDQRTTITVDNSNSNLSLTIPLNNIPATPETDKPKFTLTGDTTIISNSTKNIDVSFSGNGNSDNIEYFYVIKPIEDTIKSYTSKSISTIIPTNKTVRFHFDTTLSDFDSKDNLKPGASSTNIDTLIEDAKNKKDNKLIDGRVEYNTQSKKLNIKNKEVIFSGRLYNFTNSLGGVLNPTSFAQGQATKIEAEPGKIKTENFIVDNTDTCYANDFFTSFENAGYDFTKTDNTFLPTVKNPWIGDEKVGITTEDKNKWFHSDKMVSLYTQYYNKSDLLKLNLDATSLQFLNDGLGDNSQDPFTAKEPISWKNATDNTADAAVVAKMAADGFQYFANWTIEGDINDTNNSTRIIGYNLYFTKGTEKNPDLSGLTVESLEDRVLVFEVAPARVSANGYYKINKVGDYPTNLDKQSNLGGSLIDISGLDINNIQLWKPKLKANIREDGPGYFNTAPHCASVYHKNKSIWPELFTDEFTDEPDRLKFNHAAFFSPDSSDDNKIKRTPNLTSLIPYGSAPSPNGSPTIYTDLLNSEYYETDGSIKEIFLSEVARGDVKAWTPFSELNEILELP